jgi:Domain of unknown function (DUF5134)
VLWGTVFSVVVVVYACLLGWRIRQFMRVTDGVGRSPDHIAAASFHLIAALAMVYATIGRHRDHWTPGMDMPAAQHLPFPALGMVLAALFALDAVATVLVVIALDLPSQRNPLRSSRIAVFPHVAMDVGMATMLVAAVVG